MNATYLKAPTLFRDHLAHRPGWQYWTVNPEVRATIITLKSDDEFLVFSKGADDGAPPTDAEMVLMMQRAVGAELPISIIGHWPWTAGVALVAERFIAGRVILAGDAAHLFTPTGGFGMNTGMDDASNLAWKLAALVQGWGGANLLQSYEIERRPIAERNTVAARELNKNLINMPITPEMEQDTPEGAAARAPGQRASVDLRRGVRLDRRAARRALRRLADRDRGRRAARRRLCRTTRRRACRAAARRTTGRARAAAMATRCSTGSARASRCSGSAAIPPTRADRSRGAQARRAAHVGRSAACRRARTLRPRPRADPARPVCRMARRRAAGRSRPPDRAVGRRA